MGYEYVEDLERALKNFQDLPNHLKRIIEEYNIVEKLNREFDTVSGASLWHGEFCNPPIAVFHKGLDKLLDGGLPVGRITELCGPPGCGKTQMCLQFCVDVQIPSSLGGSAGEALFISTDFGFGVERLTQIVEASVRHCESVQPSGKEGGVSVKSLLEGVNVLEIYELNDLVRTVRNLRHFLEKNSRIKLVVIDSFSLPLIIEVKDLICRSKLTAELLDVLLDNSMRYKFAVVLTNQLATVMTSSNKSILKPSLGEGFGHRLHKRLLLDNGKVFLTKSIKQSPSYTCFEITKDGIR